MTISLVGSATDSWLIDLLKQRREAALAAEAAAQSTGTASSSAGSSNGTAAVGQPASSSVDFYKSAMKTDLSLILSIVQFDTANDANGQDVGQDGAGTDPASAATGGDSAPSSFLTDLKTLLAAAGSGDSTGTQSAAAALQAGIQSVFGDQNAAGTDAATDSTAGTRNSFVSDLQKLISSAEAGDTAGARQAAGSLAKDIQGALSGPGPVGGHHHHHHHVESADAADSTNAFNTTGSVTAASTTPQAGNALGSSEVSADSPLASARQAYELLMSFAEDRAA